VRAVGGLLGGGIGREALGGFSLGGRVVVVRRKGLGVRVAVVGRKALVWRSADVLREALVWRVLGGRALGRRSAAAGRGALAGR